MINDKVFWFMGFYIFFLILVSGLSAYGLGSLLITTTPTVTVPVLSTLPTSTTPSWTDAIINFFNYVYFFFENIAFIFTLIVANPFSTIALFSYFFTFLTIMFILCILLTIRG
jgi:hypothetical protein